MPGLACLERWAAMRSYTAVTSAQQHSSGTAWAPAHCTVVAWLVSGASGASEASEAWEALERVASEALERVACPLVASVATVATEAWVPHHS